LLRTFADQAVIAIENARLFEEVRARNRDLTALSEVGRAVSSTLDLRIVLKTIVERAVALSETDGGSIFHYRQETGRFELGETTGLVDEVVAKFRRLDISAQETGPGEAIAKRLPLQIADLRKRTTNPLRDASLEAGLRAALVVPLLGGEGPLGTLVVWRRQQGEFSEAIVGRQRGAGQSRPRHSPLPPFIGQGSRIRTCGPPLPKKESLQQNQAISDCFRRVLGIEAQGVTAGVRTVDCEHDRPAQLAASAPTESQGYTTDGLAAPARHRHRVADVAFEGVRTIEGPTSDELRERRRG
jgi:GAF domain